jgi:hypothetical protein
MHILHIIIMKIQANETYFIRSVRFLFPIHKEVIRWWFYWDLDLLVPAYFSIPFINLNYNTCATPSEI